METQFWSKVKEFHGVELLRNPETFECRIVPIERPAEPKTKVETPVTPEQMARAEAALNLHKMLCEAGERSRAAAIQPKPPQPKPMTFEEQITHDWRFNPGIRKEFASQASYTAYMRAVRDGRAKVYGRG